MFEGCITGRKLHVCMYMYVCVCVCVCVCGFTCVCVCLCVLVYVCVCVSLYLCQTRALVIKCVFISNFVSVSVTVPVSV